MRRKNVIIQYTRSPHAARAVTASSSHASSTHCVPHTLQLRLKHQSGRIAPHMTVAYTGFAQYIPNRFPNPPPHTPGAHPTVFFHMYTADWCGSSAEMLTRF